MSFIDGKEPVIINEFNLDKFFNMQKGKISYPSLFLIAQGEMLEFPVLIDGLPLGDLPVVLQVEDKLVEVARVKRDLLTINRLVKFYDCHWLESDEQRIKLNSIEDLIHQNINWS